MSGLLLAPEWLEWLEWLDWGDRAGELASSVQAVVAASAERSALPPLALLSALLGVLLIALLGSHRVVRRMRRDMQAVRNAEDEARTIFETHRDGVLVFDRGLRVLDANRAAAMLFQVPLEQLVSAPLASLLPDLAAKPPEEDTTAHVVGSPRRHAGLRGDGSSFPADVIVSEFRRGGRHLFVAGVRDVTEQADAEAVILRRLRQVEQVGATSQRLAQAETAEELGAAAAEGVRALLGTEAAATVIVDAGTGECLGLSGDSSLCQAVAATRWRPLEDVPLVVTDRAHDRYGVLGEVLERVGWTSGVLLPLMARGRVLGVVVAADPRPRAHGEEALVLSLAIARTLALALQRITTAEALRESDDRLRFALSAAGLGAWDWDVRRDRVSWSEEILPLHGGAAAAESPQFKDFLALVHPDDQDTVSVAVRRSLEEGEPYRVEYRTVVPGGHVRWIEARGHVARDAQGRAERMSGVGMDVTDRKLLERRLQEEAAVVATLERIGQTLTSEFDAARVIRVVTEEGRLLGGAEVAAFAPSEGEGATALVLGDDVARRGFDAIFGTWVHEATLVGQHVLRFDDIRDASDPDGSRRNRELPFASLLAAPVVSHSGKVRGGLFFTHRERARFTTRHQRLALGLAGWAGVALDNAELLRQEQANRAAAEAAERRFRDLVDVVGAIVWEADPHSHRFTFVSKRAEELLGHPLTSWTDAPDAWSAMLHPQHRDWAVATREEEVRLGQDHVLEYRVVTSTGAARWLHDIVRVVKDGTGKPVLLRGLMVDVTERRQVEELLRQRALQQAVVADLGQKALAGMPMDELLELATSATCSTLGLEDCRLLELEEDGTLTLRAAHGVARGRTLVIRPDAGTQEHHALASREPVIFEDLAGEVRFRPSPSLLDDGVTSGICGCVHGERGNFGLLGAYSRERRRFSQDDANFLQAVANVVAMAERRTAFENERLRAEAALSAALETLAGSAAELDAANEALSEYTSIVSHDLKAPLRAIHHYVDFLREDLSGKLEAEQQEYLDALGKSATGAQALVDALLELSRVGTRETHDEPIQLGQFFQDLPDLLGLPEDAEVRSPPDWPTIQADPVLLRQVFQNLVLNGVKFNRSPKKVVELSWTEVGGDVQVTVADNGIGIAPSHLEKIFRPFQRLHAANEFEGTGIGLAIVRKAAARLHGSVGVESTPGSGTRFTVTLPRSRADVHARMERTTLTEPQR